MKEIEHMRGELREAVGSYTFMTTRGEVSLADLFGEKRDLLVIHNMGRNCAYCTLWADGLNGVAPHIMDRTAVALLSPDDPEAQREFAQSRGWRFTMVSLGSSSFNRDMGFEPEPGQVLPGVNAFHREEDGSIVRTGRTGFCPGDSYSAIWHLFGLLRDGANGWSPKFSYGS